MNMKSGSMKIEFIQILMACLQILYTSFLKLFCNNGVDYFLENKLTERSQAQILVYLQESQEISRFFVIAFPKWNEESLSNRCNKRFSNNNALEAAPGSICPIARSPK